MYQDILSFEESYKEALSWLGTRQRSLIARASTAPLDELEKEVAEFSAEVSARLLGPGKQLMSSEAFAAATFEQKMGVTRFKTSVAAADGYGSVSLVERAILLQRNKKAGIIQKPTALKMDPARVEGSIGMVAQRLTEDDLEGAIDAFTNSQESIIKHAQIETIIASERESGPKTQAMRIIGNADTCDYCKGLAGYWTEQLWTLRHFHASCTCSIITRPL